MKILVTGSRGFIGEHLSNELREVGHKVVGIDLKNDPLTQDVSDERILYHLLLEHSPDVLIHLAAKVGRLFGEEAVAQTVVDNAAMTSTVAKACGERGIRLVYASTSEVYGDCGETTAFEGGPVRLPHNIYGLSKRWGEEACQLYAPDDLTIWRISMPYGPGLPAGRGRAALINFLYNAIHGLPITVHKNSERSWCWIGDTVNAMALTLGQPGGIWNIGRDDNAMSMLEVAKWACDLVGADYSLIHEVDAPGRQTVVKRLATEKIRGIGWLPETPLVDGMRMTLKWVETLPPPERIQVAA